MGRASCRPDDTDGLVGGAWRAVSLGSADLGSRRSGQDTRGPGHQLRAERGGFSARRTLHPPRALELPGVVRPARNPGHVPAHHPGTHGARRLVAGGTRRRDAVHAFSASGRAVLRDLARDPRGPRLHPGPAHPGPVRGRSGGGEHWLRLQSAVPPWHPRCAERGLRHLDDPSPVAALHAFRRGGDRARLRCNGPGLDRGLRADQCRCLFAAGVAGHAQSGTVGRLASAGPAASARPRWWPQAPGEVRSGTVTSVGAAASPGGRHPWPLCSSPMRSAAIGS